MWHLDKVPSQLFATARTKKKRSHTLGPSCSHTYQNKLCTASPPPPKRRVVIMGTEFKCQSIRPGRFTWNLPKNHGAFCEEDRLPVCSRPCQARFHVRPCRTVCSMIRWALPNLPLCPTFHPLYAYRTVRSARAPRRRRTDCLAISKWPTAAKPR